MSECTIRTPQLEDVLASPNLAAFTPTTRRRLRALRCGEMPSGPIRTPAVDPFDKNPATLDSAFGALLRPGEGRLSKAARKRLWQVVLDLPSQQPDPISDQHTSSGDKTPLVNKTRRVEPPLSTSTPNALPAAVDAQLLRPNETPRDSVSYVPVPPPDSEPGPESQANTVGWNDTTVGWDDTTVGWDDTTVGWDDTTGGWDDTTVGWDDTTVGWDDTTVGWDDTTPTSTQQQRQTEPEPEEAVDLIKRFMVSSRVDNREEIIETIYLLGGAVCEGLELDPAASHLLCAAPSRSEKMLGSVAAGRWVLHPLYVADSAAAGNFLPEEDYEWGNPRASRLPAVCGRKGALARAAHRWRVARARGAAGPYAGVRALLHVPDQSRGELARLVRAGDGDAPEHEPPYTDEKITVCFADKQYPMSARDKEWLFARSIPVCASVLLSSYLTDDPPPKPEDHCLPEFIP